MSQKCLLCLTFILNAMGLVGPFFFGKMIDSLHTKENIWYSLALASIGIVFAVISRTIEFRKHFIDLSEVRFPIQEYIRMQTIDRYFCFSIGQHSASHSEVTQQTMSNGEEAMQSLARTMVQNYLPMIMRCIVIFLILLYLSPLLAMILISGIAIYVFCQSRFEKKYRPLIKKQADKNLASRKQRGELIRGVRLIKSFSKEVPMREKYRDQLQQSVAYTQTISYYIYKWDNTFSLIIDATDWAVKLTCIYLIFNNSFTVGEMCTVGMWCDRMSSMIKTVSNDYQTVLQQIEQIERFFKLIDTAPAITEVEKPVKLEKVEGFIDFKHLSFTYPQTPQEDEDVDEKKPVKAPRIVLEKVNFSIRAGQRVAIVGPSGSGKSTLITLLMRGYDPSSGSIAVDGHDLRTLSLNAYYRHVAVVDQSSLMMDMTIRDCVQMGSQTNLFDDEITMLCKLMELDMDSFESGLNTKVGQDGRKLSGGERQRLAIARALASNPRILILDEATASLDGIAEAKIQRAIDVASEGRTTIIIAHRLATVQHADKIFVLEEGRVSAEGTHRELLRNSALYMELVEKQKILT